MLLVEARMGIWFTAVVLGTLIHTRTHTQTNTHTHAYTHARTPHARTPAHTHTHTHTHTHKHTHTHTHTHTLCSSPANTNQSRNYNSKALDLQSCWNLHTPFWKVLISPVHGWTRDFSAEAL